MARRTLLSELGEYLRDRRSWRAWSLAAQDGIIATAGILLGFAGAGAGDATLLVAATAATVAGMLSAGGANWSQAAAEREGQLHALYEERTDIDEWQQEAARSELVEYYEQKGLDHQLAAQVVDQLMIRSPLKTALEYEHGILEVTSRAEVLLTGVCASLAYALGAAIPFVMTFYLPVNIETWVIFLAVLVSLTAVSLVGAHAGHMNAPRTIVRTLIVGVITVTVSYLVGEIAFQNMRPA
jgi:VIT1/CCC1 family predicted Fe2+/Mn2+ transporter